MRICKEQTTEDGADGSQPPRSGYPVRETAKRKPHEGRSAQPGYPDPALGERALILPAGRVQFAPNLVQPRLSEAIAAIEQTLPGEVRLNTMYIRRRGSNKLRGVNINARPQQRLFLAANYTFGRSIDDTDSPFSLPADNYNLAAERGPSLGFSRHRFMSLANLPLKKRFRLGTSLRVQSAAPYNITTGRDDNGDTVSNDRPADVTRNTGLGRAQVDLGLRLSWGIAFGGAAPPPASATRWSLYAQAYNALNHFNALNFSGVVTSPFFGQPTSAAAPRRVELGARLTF